MIFFLNNNIYIINNNNNIFFKKILIIIYVNISLLHFIKLITLHLRNKKRRRKNKGFEKEKKK